MRQHIGVAIEQVAGHRFAVQRRSLGGDARIFSVVGLVDDESGRSTWRSRTPGGLRGRETRLVGDFVYRRTLSEDGKPSLWTRSAVTCQGFGEARGAFAYVVRNSIRAQTGELTNAGDQAAGRYSFEFGAIRGDRDPRAVAIDAYMRSHNAPRMTLTAAVGQRDGRLLALRLAAPVMTTCDDRPLLCQSTNDWFDLGIEVPEIEVPIDDDIDDGREDDGVDADSGLD
jgi:hypothetical protein